MLIVSGVDMCAADTDSLCWRHMCIHCSQRVNHGADFSEDLKWTYRQIWKIKQQVYSLSDAFAVPASFVRILFADRVGQSAVEGPWSDDTGQEITQLHVQLSWYCSMRRGRCSCVHLEVVRRRFPRCSCIRTRNGPFVRWLQLRTTAHFSHLKHVNVSFFTLLRFKVQL